ncbi:MAG: hypothetical protein QOJ66_1161, partial [Ilumatobacteraceae bacterium]
MAPSSKGFDRQALLIVPNLLLSLAEGVPDRHRLVAADERGLGGLRFAGKFERLEPRDEVAEQRSQLHSGELGAETEVDAIAEGDVLCRVGTSHVEPER